MIAACLTKAEPYIPRSPRKSQYYRCVEANFEELELAVQTFGDFLNFNPHYHIIATGWSFRSAPLLAHAAWMVVLSMMGFS